MAVEGTGVGLEAGGVVADTSTLLNLRGRMRIQIKTHALRYNTNIHAIRILMILIDINDVHTCMHAFMHTYMQTYIHTYTHNILV